MLGMGMLLLQDKGSGDRKSTSLMEITWITVSELSLGLIHRTLKSIQVFQSALRRLASGHLHLQVLKCAPIKAYEN